MSDPNSGHTELPIPNGWFALAFSSDLVPGDVKRIRYFDRELVLYRGRSGEAAVLDGYCAHLGAHLGEGGRVVGDSIRCPFHGWRYDASGACVEIPYCKRIPPRARVRAWDVVERNQMIFAWHHAEGKPPDWDVPTMPEFDDPDWTEPRRFELEVPVHMQEMAENNCDPIHFQFVHGALEVPESSEMSYGEDGRFFRISSTNRHETPAGTFEIELERDTWGIGLSSVRMKGIPNAGLLMFSSTAPVDSRNAHSRWLFTVSRDMADLVGEEFIKGMSEGVLQDIRIWKHKIHRADPVLCEADRYLAEFRRWARQFYSASPAQTAQEE
ncbi:MAG: Rieske 2Fe-2S domain-containing protein [Proteobacteria bacterium]|nr:Rieske 2Fe-2S domain-containing protein [Pseudomonadota bacterium]